MAPPSAAKGGAWLAAFRGLSQLCSWLGTIVVARTLAPEDYGLAMLAIAVAGAVEVLGEFGLGPALVQREHLHDDEVASAFWLSAAMGAVLCGAALLLAGPAAALLDEPRVAPLVRAMSLVLLVAPLMAVPLGLLTRRLRFREIGAAHLGATCVASIGMVVMARAEFGVWTLVWGQVLLRATTVALVLAAARWRPRVHCRLHDVRPFLRFGASITGTRLLYFASQQLDRLVVSRVVGTEGLGYYGFARDLAAVPKDKLVSLVTQVAYPVLSRCQKSPDRLAETYLRIERYLALIVLPLYAVGIALGGDLIVLVFGPRWEPIGWLFRMFCLSELLVALTSLNSVVHNARGRPEWVFKVTVATVVLMLPALWVAGRAGVDALAIPWVTIYPAIGLTFALLTIRTLGITPARLGRQLRPAASGAAVALVALATGTVVLEGVAGGAGAWLRVPAQAAVLLATYAAYLWVRERTQLVEIWRLFR